MIEQQPNKEDELNALRTLSLEGLMTVHSLLTLEEMAGKDITKVREMVWQIFNEKIKGEAVE